MREIQETIKWVNQQHGMHVLAIIPSTQVEEPGWEPVWVVSGSQSNPNDRKIYLVFSTKHISEEEGITIIDCPKWFFELVPNIKDQNWRKACLDYWG